MTRSINECICQTHHIPWKYEARLVHSDVSTSCPKTNNPVSRRVTAGLNGPMHISRIADTIASISCKAPPISPRRRTTKSSESQYAYALSPYLSCWASHGTLVESPATLRLGLQIPKVGSFELCCHPSMWGSVMCPSLTEVFGRA